MPDHKQSPEVEEARARNLDAEASKYAAETRKAIADAEVAEIKRDREAEKRDEELTANELHKVYVFDSEVSAGSVKKCIAQLTVWDRTEPECPVTIEVNSPGGSIIDGFALVDYIREFRSRGHEVTMVGLGMVASMAGVLMQAADRRILGRHAFLLIHEGSLGAIGDFGDVEDRVELMQLMHGHILNLFEERATPINPSTTAEFVKKNWKRKDWWITADKAAELGFVDEVR